MFLTLCTMSAFQHIITVIYTAGDMSDKRISILTTFTFDPVRGSLAYLTSQQLYVMEVNSLEKVLIGLFYMHIDMIDLKERVCLCEREKREIERMRDRRDRCRYTYRML